MVAAPHPGAPTGCRPAVRWPSLEPGGPAAAGVRPRARPAALRRSASLIGFALVRVPVVPLTALVIPMVIANLVLGPRTLPVVRGASRSACWCVVAGAPPRAARRATHRRRRGRSSLIGLIILVSSFRRTWLGVAGVRGESMLVDLRDRIQRRRGCPRCRTAGTPRRCCARPAARRSPATSWSASRSPTAGACRSPWSTSPARASRPAPARCCSPAPSAGCSARCRRRASCRRQRLPAPPGLGRGLRHRRARAPWTCETGALRAALGRPPARACSCRRVGPLGGARGRGAGARADAGRRVHAWCTGPLDRGDALLLFTDGLVETPQRDISLGIDKLLGQGERLLREGFEQGAAPADRPARVAQRRPGAAAPAPALSGGCAASRAWSG